MPNPFVRLGSMNLSTTSVDRPLKRLRPVPERYAGDNNPYRGTEPHGVSQTVSPHGPEVGFDAEDPAGDSGRHFVPVEPDQHEPEPIPVRIVSGDDDRRQYREFMTDSFNAITDTTQVVGRDDRRSVVKIKNFDAAAVALVGSNRADIAIRGYTLAPGQELSMTTEMPVYVRSSDGVTGVHICVLVEFGVRES